MARLTKGLGRLAKAGTRLAGELALVTALAACALGSGSGPGPATGAPPRTVPVQNDLPQAPPAVPSKPVTQTPLGPPGGTVATPAPTGPIKVGLLLPLTGNGANVGTEMLNAAQLALFDLGEDRFQLLPRDTKGTPAEAAEGARRLIAEGAKVILGPLFSPEVAAISPVIQAAGVNALTFTTEWQRAGNGTYVMGLVPAEQVARVLGYAQMRGIQRLGVLAPRTPYGEAVLAAVRDVAQRRNIAIVREERYGTETADMAGAVARLAGSGGSRSALETQKRSLAARTDEASRAALARLQTQEAQSAGASPFDAVFVAEGGDKLRALAPMLAANRITQPQIRVLGTGLLDDPGLATLPALAGAWYAAPAPQGRLDFEARFDTLYHHKPQRLATLAYDATSLAAVLARSPATAGFDTASLTNLSGFSGVDGIFRLRTDGLVERGLAVIEAAPGGPRVIDDSPGSFEALTN